MAGFVCVGIGGALGAMLRYAISLIPFKGGFPVLTLITNVLGALAIGMIAGAAARKGLPQNAVLWRIYDIFHFLAGGIQSVGTGACKSFSFVYHLECHLLSGGGGSRTVCGGTYCIKITSMQQRLRLTNPASVP